ncbi:uncharacterized protein F4817DRAFT_365285 [Daldinia loculata]|uniref:uncharacterized protein n=1 Tax=Daldinia loculata TaxID=103429 RepID=UPI0020C4B735|nr:uncharacterized protein F4817DRAFT_365285 [Daldinia loculata]KAI1647317.1 hypothetical protein F4817DRAFT_365285 [Daldinia loculata]
MSHHRPKAKEGIIWVPGMPLGPGAPHNVEFKRRLESSERFTGSGTVFDPMVIWLVETAEQDEEKLLAIERVVRQETARFGLSYAWLQSDAHSTSTIAVTAGRRVMNPDDFHVTLRMGDREDNCKVHGHIYLICEDNDLHNVVTRPMEHSERGVVGGRSPQLWVWGRYPSQYPRSNLPPVVTPHKIIPGSILAEQQRKKF